jgi:hypothetical protein
LEVAQAQYGLEEAHLQLQPLWLELGPERLSLEVYLQEEYPN